MLLLSQAQAQTQEGRPASGQAPAEPAYFVAPTGDDTGPGTIERPFATLERAQKAMRGSAVRRTYLAGGVYPLAATVTLGKQDAGTTIEALPGAVPELSGQAAELGTLLKLEGAHGVLLQGLGFAYARPGGAAVVLQTSHGVRIAGARIHDVGTGIVLTGSSGNQVVQSTIERTAESGIEAKDGSDGNVFEHNSIRSVGAPNQQGGAFFLHGTANNRIAANLIEDTAGSGIGVANWDDTTINTGTVIAGNTVRNTSTRSQDSGAIYILGRSHVDTGILVTGNLVDGTGEGGAAHTIGIYLDDSTSGVQVTGNVVRNIGTHAVQVHGGDDCVVTGNLFDLGTGATSAVLFQAAPADTKPTNTMRGNVVRGNVVVARGAGQSAYTMLDGGVPTIEDNVYLGLAADQVSVDLSGPAPTLVAPPIGAPRLTALGSAPAAAAPPDPLPASPDPR